MQNPEIDLRSISSEQPNKAQGCEQQHDGPADTQIEPWIEEYAASGAAKGGVIMCM